MPVTTGHQKAQTNIMKAFPRPRPYIYHPRQLGHVTPGLSLLVSVCVLMLPMLGLVDEHAQLTTMYHMSPINQCYVRPHHMTFNHIPLLLPSLSNILPAMILQNRAMRLNIGCPSCTLPQSGVRHVSPGPNLPFALGRRVVGVVLVLLLLLSGDIETNPGPVGQQLTVDDLPVVREELNSVSAKWYDIGLQLGVNVGRLEEIKEYSAPERLRETLMTWLKTNPLPPTWTKIVNALKSNTVGEVRLATDLEHKYCSAHDTSTTATHHPAPPAPAVPPSQVPTWATPLPQSTWSPVFTSPYPVPPQPYPSHSLPWSAPYYYPPPTSYPVSTPFLSPSTSYPMSTPSLPPPTSYPLSIPSLPPPTSYPVSTPSLPPPPSGAASTAAVTLSPQSTVPITPPYHPSQEQMVLLDKESVKQHVRQLQTRFRGLVISTYTILIYKRVDVDLRGFRCSLLALDVSQKHEHQQFINDHLMRIEPATTFDDLWAKLNNYWNFLNFDLLEHIVSIFGSEELKQKMESYEHDLQSFRKATRVCDFISCWPVRGETPPKKELRKFVAKMKHDWDSCTLEDLETLKGVITRKFFLPGFALQLREIIEGSITITWFIPAPFVNTLMEAIESTSSRFFMEQNIETITIDGKECYSSLTRKPIDYLKELTTFQTAPQPAVAAELSGTQFQEYLVNATIPERIQTMEIKFHQLVDKVQDGLLEQNIPLQGLKRCITRLPAFTKDQHIAFISKNLTAIRESESVEEIFSLLSSYWDFLNYTLLEHIVDKFGNNDTKASMVNYVAELVAFRRTTKLSDFISHWPFTGKLPPDMSELVIIMEKDWSNSTLEDVEQFRRTLTQELLLSSFAVYLEDAVRGRISATFKYSTFLRKLYTSQKSPPTLSSSPLPQKLLPFKLARIEKEKVSADEFTRRYLRGDMDDVGSLGTEFYKKSPIKFEDVGILSISHKQKLILIEGAPGVGKTTFSWEFCRKWGRGEILQEHSLLLLLPLRDNNLKEAKTLSDLFYHPNSKLQQAVVQEVTSNQGQGVAIWLEAWDELDHEPREKASVFLNLIHGRILPLATVFVTSRPWASEHLRQNCEHRITQHVEILTSAKDQIEHYISKAEAEAQPSSFAAKFTDYLSSNPVIRAAMYTPVTAKMAAEVFTWSQHTESAPPTTMTELFTAFTLKTLVDHLSTHPVYQKQQLKVTTFSDLPTDVYKQFQDLCRMAYEGILNRQQLVFSAAHLPTGFAPLGLMQEVPQLYTEGRASSYHFIHLTLQEYLAAVHISQLSARKQTILFQRCLHSGYFKMTIRFVAGLTKLANIPPEISTRLIKNDDTKFTYFHFLFEAEDISMTTRTLGSDEMAVWSNYSWTPLDYYVTGHAISHSNCSWRLNFGYTSIDDEKFELFCQGCAAPGGTGCRGHISYADFGGNDLSSKSIQSFVNIPPHIPPHILQDMRVLDLNSIKLDGSACDLLAKAVPSMSRLEGLWLSYNPIGSGGAVEVIKALCGSGVKKLKLYNTGIGVPDCEALCKLLTSSHSTLEDLNIAHNTIGEEGVTAVAKMLVENKSLTVLRLFGCHISGQGASELAAALCKNSTLKYLYLDDNPIGVEGASSMSDMLQHNTSLEHLWLCDDSVGEEGVRQLINSLKHNQTLRELRLPKKYESETSDHRIDWW